MPKIGVAQENTSWPQLPDDQAGIVIRVLDAEQALAVSAIHLGVPIAQLTNDDQSIDIQVPIDEAGFAVFTADDLAAALSNPDKQISRLNLINESGQGQRIAGHLSFGYDYLARTSNKRIDAVVYLFPGEAYAPSEDFQSGGGAGNWNYYRPNEMPALMLVPPNETIQGFLQEKLRPVLLLHDVGGSYPFWVDEAQNGFIHQLNTTHHVWQLYYPYDQEIEKSAAMLEAVLPRLFNPEDFDGSYMYDDPDNVSIPVVAHGMGGLVIRKYVRDVLASQVKIDKILMLGTPNHGSFASYKVFYKKYHIQNPTLKKLFGNYPDHNAPAYKQMTLSSKFLHELNQPAGLRHIRSCTTGHPYNCYLVIAGTKDQSEGEFTSIQGQQDGVVSVSSASLLGKVVPLITASLTHRELAHKTPVGIIRQFLKKGYTFASLENASFDHLDGYYSYFLRREDTNLLTTPNIGQIQVRLNGNQAYFNELSRIGAMVATREEDVIRFEYGCSSMFDRDKRNIIRRVSTPRVTSEENFFFSERVLGVNRIGTEIGFAYPEDYYEVVFYRRWFSNDGYPCGEYTRIADLIPFRHLRTTMFEKDVNEAESVMFAANNYLSTTSTTADDKLQPNAYSFKVDPSVENLVVYFNASKSTDASNHELKLQTPEGTVLDASNSASNSAEFEAEFHESIKGGYAYFYIKNPASGNWQVNFNESLEGAYLSIPIISTLPVSATFSKESFEVGEEASFTISTPAPLESASVKAVLYHEQDTGHAAQLHTLSLEASDAGVLSGKFLPESPGIYAIQFTVTGTYQGQPVERGLSILTGVNGQEIRNDKPLSDEQPSGFALENNYPNPFNPTTTIRFHAPEAAQISLKVFDVTGRLVKTLADQFFEAGTHERTWDASLHNGANAPSGVYFYTLESPSLQQRITRSMQLIK